MALLKEQNLRSLAGAASPDPGSPVLPRIELASLDSGCQEDMWEQQAVKSAQKLTGPQVGGTKSRSQFWSLTPVLIFPFA